MSKAPSTKRRSQVQTRCARLKWSPVIEHETLTRCREIALRHSGIAGWHIFDVANHWIVRNQCVLRTTHRLTVEREILTSNVARPSVLTIAEAFGSSY